MEIPPPSLFSCTRLTVLKLKTCILTTFPTDFSRFRRLTKCTLRHTTMTDDSLARLLSHCPLLRKFNFMDCVGLQNPVISALNLRDLALQFHKPQPLTVNCPKLRTLKANMSVKDLRLNGLKFHEISPMIETLQMGSGSNLIELRLHSRMRYNFSVRRFLELVGTLRSLKVLVFHLGNEDREAKVFPKVVPFFNLVSRLPNLEHLHLRGKLILGINVPDSLIQDAARTLLTLLNQIFASPSSPYRPFGTYMLCSSNGAACIQNAQTVLEMLSLTMPSPQTSFDEIVQACLSEHIRYDSVLEEVLQNSIRGIRSIENSNSESPYEMGILLQLEAIGVGAQNDHAQLALRKAGETEKRYNTNVKELAIKLSLKQSRMAELEWYKERCEKDGGIGYYDTFKNQDMKDIGADTRRVQLAEFWDEIIEMWENHELPSDFQSQNKWINAGTTYRKLVEPLDIAYYYRNNSNGYYLSDGRPKRHKVLQEWMEAKEKTRSSRGQRSRGKRASLTEDSCFWANVEEAWKDLENLKQGQHQSLQRLEQFEKYVTTMNDALKISADVLFEESRFMTWKAEWEKYKREHSPYGK